MDLGCPLLRGSSDRRLRWCAATDSVVRRTEKKDERFTDLAFFYENAECKMDFWWRLRISSATPVIMWWDSSSSELFGLPEWWEENTTSGQGSFKERSPVGFQFSESSFLDVPGTATEQVRTCGFRRNSSSLDKAPKIRDSVRLNSFESFFSDPSFNFFRNLGDVLLSHLWINCVSRLSVPRNFRWFSWNCR